MGDNHQKVSLVISGKLLEGFDKGPALRNMAKYFNCSHQQAKNLVDGKRKVLKEGIDHASAYTAKEKLIEFGIEASIEAILPEEAPTNFSMVPEGEENTNYETLQAKINQGEKIRCDYCGSTENYAAFCSQCGKPLMGKMIDIESTEVHAESNSLTKTVVAILILAIVLFAVLYFIQ